MMREEVIMDNYASVMETVWEYTYYLLLILTVCCCILIVPYWRKRAALKIKRKRKKDQCKESLENLSKHSAPGHPVTYRRSQKSENLDLPMETLLKKLISDEYGAMDVLTECQQKAYEVNKEFNCIVEPIKEAEDLATECDKMRNSKEQHKRPLHGVPVSLKENYFLKGYDCTAGMSDYIGKPCEEDAVIVQVLKNQGAVPFVRTNIPQTMMTGTQCKLDTKMDSEDKKCFSYECSNPIYGQTVNPHDRTRGPGGSSGGEGCLIGAKGSLLGFGSDIGGSIRIPSHMCGVCGLKPTFGRLSVKGTHELGQGQTLINAATGPMARDVTSLVIAMKALLCDDMFDLDPTVPPIPFRMEIYEKTHKLKIGYCTFDGYLKPVPACQRAVIDAKTILENQGHKDDVVGKGIRSICKTQNVYDWWKLAERLQEYKKKFLSLWRSHELDVLICPGFAFPAVPNGEVFNVLGGVTYTALYNLLDYPAGTVPVTKVTSEDEAGMQNYPTTTRYERFIKKYYSKGTVGLPVGVQCVGLPYQEELVLRVMKMLENEDPCHRYD